MQPTLAVTIGDPRGIGPEIVRAALADPVVGERCRLVLVGAEGTGVDVHHGTGQWSFGGDAASAGAHSGRAIEHAVDLALKGAVEGIVTAPINKAALLLGGYDFTGHTEMLATLTGSRVAMMLTSTKPTAGGHPLRVVLATTHVALRDVPRLLDENMIVETAEIIAEHLPRWFAVERPRIALCALNPHAGDDGRFGDEDAKILVPAAKRANIAGPFPADTVFVRAMRGEFDVVIAPYHDVGMTAIKVAAFGSAVNVTLGLPFPRTAPDHGTALDIAGRGVADASSFIAATLLCAELAVRAQTRGGRPPNAGPLRENRSAGRPSSGP